MSNQNRRPDEVRRLLEQQLGEWFIFGATELDSRTEIELKILAIHDLMLEFPRDDGYYHQLTQFVIPRAVFYCMVFTAHQRQQRFNNRPAARPERASTPVPGNLLSGSLSRTTGEGDTFPDPE